MRIEGCTAVVTGAGRGLGLALVHALAQAGAARIVAGVRRPQAWDDARVQALPLDVTQADSLAEAARRSGPIDLLINNAGVMQPDDALLAEGGAEALRQQLATNLFGALAVTQAFADSWRRGGCIVNLLSALSWASLPHTSAYSISKAAAWAMTNGLRNELRPGGTQVVGVHVGYIDTDMARAVQAPKLAPAYVAQQILQGVEAGLEEILVDDTARQVKQGMQAPRPLYLGAPLRRR